MNPQIQEVNFALNNRKEKVWQALLLTNPAFEETLRETFFHSQDHSSRGSGPPLQSFTKFGIIASLSKSARITSAKVCSSRLTNLARHSHHAKKTKKKVKVAFLRQLVPLGMK